MDRAPATSVGLLPAILDHAASRDCFGPAATDGRCQRGFSLIELVVALVVAGILAGYAVPNFRTMIQENRLVAQTNDFIADVNFARSEAIKRGDRLVLCPDNGTQTACGTNWSAGRLVWVDVDGDGAMGGPSDVLLRVRGPLSGPANTLTSFVAQANPLIIDDRGMVASLATVPGGEAVFAICDERGAEFGRDIAVTLTGQTRFAKPAGRCS